MLEEWIRDNCVLENKARTGATILYEDFDKYSDRKITQTMFGRAMGKSFRRTAGKGKKYYRGIRLKDKKDY